MQLSIVAPIYKGEKMLDEQVRRISGLVVLAWKEDKEESKNKCKLN